MSYTPTTWTTGDVITAEKLNNIEDGIAGAGGVFIVKVLLATEGDHSGQYYLDKTPAEMIEAYNNGLFITSDTTIYQNTRIVDNLFSFTFESECELYFNSERGKFCANGFVSSFYFITDGTLTKEEAMNEILWEDMD